MPSPSVNDNYLVVELRAQLESLTQWVKQSRSISIDKSEQTNALEANSKDREAMMEAFKKKHDDMLALKDFID